jgi:hypothetical protein
MYFLNPTYLWAFLGLTVPIAIHLWSKKEGKTIKVGSIQLLNKADTKQSRSIQLNEIWLLVLRLFLISVLVLIISNLRIRKKVDTVAITYIVESSLLQNKGFRTILNTISTDVPMRLLQNGFPEIDVEANQKLDTAIPNYWQLAKEMRSLPSDSIIVFTSAFQSGFKGLRPEITKPIEWITISVDKTRKHLLEVNQFNEQLELLVMNSSDQQISFDKGLLKSNNPKIKWNTAKDSIFYLENWTAINTEKTNQVLLFYDFNFLSESKYFEASFKVVSQYLNHKINLVKTNDLEGIDTTAFDIVIWLSKKPILNTNAKVLVFKSNQFTSRLIEESSIKGTYHLTRFLDAENAENAHLPEQLIQLLDLNPAIAKKINQYDTRVLAKEAMVPIYSKHKLDPSNDYSLDMTKWLWLLFVLLLTSERILSYYKSQ